MITYIVLCGTGRHSTIFFPKILPIFYFPKIPSEFLSCRRVPDDFPKFCEE